MITTLRIDGDAWSTQASDGRMVRWLDPVLSFDSMLQVDLSSVFVC
jgi:hypothetical protein